MKWSDVTPEDFEFGEYCWVKPNIWGEDEPDFGELSRHIYPDGDGNFGVLIETVCGVIDIDAEPVKRRYCMIPPPPEHEWSDVPPENTNWY